MRHAEKTQLILHIGDPKTGTSSIQRALQLGLVSSEAGDIEAFNTRGKQVNAISVARAFRKNDPSDALRWGKELNEWLRKSDVGFSVLTSEYFSRSDVALLANTFNRELPEYMPRLKVIAYVRPHAGRMLSAFVQRTKTGRNLNDFEGFARKIHHEEVLNYAPRFMRWHEAFGKRFHLRPFLRAELVDGDAVTDFFTEVFEGQPFSISQNVSENTSLSERTLSGIQLFHRRLIERRTPDRLRAGLARAIYEAVPSNPEIPRSKPKLDRKTLQHLADRYLDDAAFLDETFFGRDIFRKELENAWKTAPADLINLTPNLHFDHSEQHELITLIDKISETARSNMKFFRAEIKKNKMSRQLNAGTPDGGYGEMQKTLQSMVTLLE